MGEALDRLLGQLSLRSVKTGFLFVCFCFLTWVISLATNLGGTLVLRAFQVLQIKNYGLNYIFISMYEKLFKRSTLAAVRGQCLGVCSLVPS